MATKKETKPKTITGKKNASSAKKKVAAKIENAVSNEQKDEKTAEPEVVEIKNDETPIESVPSDDIDNREATVDDVKEQEHKTQESNAEEDVDPGVFVVEDKKEFVEPCGKKKFVIPKPVYHPFGIIYK